MNEVETRRGSEAAAPAVTVDEKVVRKMLQINPALRDGRTTFQVKKDLEHGQAVHTDDGPATGPVPASPQREAAAGTSPARSNGARGDLEETVSFFIKGRAEDFESALNDIAERRRALDAEEQQAAGELSDQLARFLAMLDETIVAMHGVSVLSRHGELLGRLGLDPAKVLEMTRQVRR